MSECAICGKSGEDLSLIYVRHKDLGYVGICQDCWEKEWEKNLFVTSGGEGGGGCCG